MTKIEISKAAASLVTAHVEFYGNHSEGNKAHFKTFYDLVKAKKTRVTTVTALGEASKKIVLESSKREFIANVKMAVAFADIQAVMNLTAVNWDNLKRGVRLYSKVLKNFKEDEVKEFIKDLGEVWDKDMSEFRYNNTLETTLKNLNEKYTVVKEEEHTKILERIYTDTDALTIGELTDLITKLQENLTAKGQTVPVAEETVEETEQAA